MGKWKRRSFLQIMGYSDDFESLLFSALHIHQRDESVKTRVNSWNLLKENLEEYCKENNIFMEESNYTYYGSYTPDCKTMLRLRYPDVHSTLIIKKLFDSRDNTVGKYEIVFDGIFRKLHCRYYYYDFKNGKISFLLLSGILNLRPMKTLNFLEPQSKRKRQLVRHLI